MSLKIDLEIKSITSEKASIKDDVVVQWIRGPLSVDTQKYSFVDKDSPGVTVKKMITNDKFQKISTFYQEKNGSW